MGNRLRALIHFLICLCEKAFIQARRTKVKSIFIQGQYIQYISISITEWKLLCEYLIRIFCKVKSDNTGLFKLENQNGCQPRKKPLNWNALGLFSKMENRISKGYMLGNSYCIFAVLQDIQYSFCFCGTFRFFPVAKQFFCLQLLMLEQKILFFSLANDQTKKWFMGFPSPVVLRPIQG